MLYRLAPFIAMGALVVAVSVDGNLDMSDMIGGQGGSQFNDLGALPMDPRVQSVILRGGRRLDAIKISLTNGRTLEHGGTGGHPQSLNLAPDEYISSIRLCEGSGSITYAKVTVVNPTSKREVSAGRESKNCRDLAAKPGFGVVGTIGQSGDEIYRLGIISSNHAPRPQLCGAAQVPPAPVPGAAQVPPAPVPVAAHVPPAPVPVAAQVPPAPVP